MSTPLKFEFDFDEVFEGIKLGVMKEMSEMTFDEITSSAVNQIKSEMKNKISLTYKDEHDIKDEIKKEIKDKVYQTLLTEIRDDYKKRYEDAFGDDVTSALDAVEDEFVEEIKTKTVNRLYDNLYLSIKGEVKSKLNDSVAQIIDTITGNSIKVRDADNSISKEEYKELLHRSEILTALENGGVDNWTWYSESLKNYFGDDEE